MNIQSPITDDLKMIADSMGISLYQRLTINEASLFLHCPIADIRKLLKRNTINYIQVNDQKVEFFGFQLLEHLLSTTTQNKIRHSMPENLPDRIIRAKEVQSMTGLSRTTLWRLENKGEFPRRVSLGANSIGWKLSEIKSWIEDK